MSFGTRLRERRKTLGIRREELADSIGVTATAISNYETDHSMPRIEILYKIFDALHCDANCLFQDFIKATNFGLSPDESELLDCYRSLNDEGKILAMNTILYLQDREYMEALISKANRKYRKGLS